MQYVAAMHVALDTYAAADAARLEEMLAFMDGEGVSLFDLHTYDAVWASAIGAAVAAAAKPNKMMPPTGSEIMQQIAMGNVPGFLGAAGFHKFLPNGDADMNFTKVGITNYQVQPETSQGKQVVVGLVDLKDSGDSELDIRAIIWPNGRSYPDYVSNRCVVLVPDPGVLLCLAQRMSNRRRMLLNCKPISPYLPPPPTPHSRSSQLADERS